MRSELFAPSLVLLLVSGFAAILNGQISTKDLLALPSGAIIGPGNPSSVEMGPEVQPTDQGFLQCSVTSLDSQYRHENTTRLAQNLAVLTNAKAEAVIVGHGWAGVLCTGNGDSCNGQTDLMLAWDNMPAWQQKMQGLRGKYKSLTLLGCSVGAGKTLGSQLLNELSQVTQLPVRAPDSMIMCGPDGITFFSSDGGWVQSNSPAKAGKATEQEHKVAPAIIYKFSVDSSFAEVKPEAVTVSSFQHRGYRDREFHLLHLPNSHSLLARIDFEHPVVTKSRPGAIVTGKLTVQFRFKDSLISRELILYNDELLEDTTNQDVFYKTDGSLSKFIDDLVR